MVYAWRRPSNWVLPWYKSIFYRAHLDNYADAETSPWHMTLNTAAQDPLRRPVKVVADHNIGISAVFEGIVDHTGAIRYSRDT